MFDWPREEIALSHSSFSPVNIVLKGCKSCIMTFLLMDVIELSVIELSMFSSCSICSSWECSIQVRIVTKAHLKLHAIISAKTDSRFSNSCELNWWILAKSWVIIRKRFKKETRANLMVSLRKSRAYSSVYSSSWLFKGLEVPFLTARISVFP